MVRLSFHIELQTTYHSHHLTPLYNIQLYKKETPSVISPQLPLHLPLHSPVTEPEIRATK